MNDKHAPSIRDLKLKEQRRYRRFSRSGPAVYRIINLDDAPRRGRTISISGVGVRFRSDIRLPKGKTVALEIDLPKSPSLVLAVGTVVWSKPAGDNSYENEVEFLWTGHKEKKTIDAGSLDSLVSGLETEGMSFLSEEP
jgi:hypothetical protein